MDEHKKLIVAYYRKAKGFKDFFPVLENILYSKRWELLAELNIAVIKAICAYLQIKTRFVRGSDLTVEGSKTQLLVNICKRLGATHHLTGSINKDYIEWGLFEKNNIGLVHQKFEHPVYAQLYGDFIPKLSCIDMLLNLGKEAKEYFAQNKKV